MKRITGFIFLCTMYTPSLFANDLMIGETVVSNFLPITLQTKTGEQIHVLLPRQELPILQKLKPGDELLLVTPMESPTPTEDKYE
jgi:hypothetical protein